MFYSDETMHKINVDKVLFDFTYQLPIMVYSLLVSTVLKILINTLGLYEGDILSIKNSKIKNISVGQEVLYRIKCKIFFIFYCYIYFIIFILDIFGMFLRCI